MEQIEMQARSRTPLRVPLPVREAWGDVATDAFTDWMEVAVLSHMVPRDEHREILSRMDVLESRMGGLEGRMGGLEGRMDSLERAVLQNRLEFHQRLDGLRAEFKEELGVLRAEFKEELGVLRAEFKGDLHEHRRETRIAIDDLRQEMRDGFQAMRMQMDVMNDRILVQTRWMVGSLTIIGALVTLLLTVGMFVK